MQSEQNPHNVPSDLLVSFKVPCIVAVLVKHEFTQYSQIIYIRKVGLMNLN